MVTALNNGGTAWKADITPNINSGYPILSWQVNVFTLTFDAAGGTVSPATRSVTYGIAIGTLPIPTRAGYAFGGWKIDGSVIAATTRWHYTANKTAVALWRTHRLYLTKLFEGALLAVGTHTPQTPITDYTYRWYKGSSPLPDSKQYIRLSGSGTYKVEVTTTSGDIIVLSTTHTVATKVKVYPNPATTVVNVAGEDIAKIEIMNLQGVVCRDVCNASLPITVDISGLPSGIYIVRISHSAGMVSTEKIIVR